MSDTTQQSNVERLAAEWEARHEARAEEIPGVATWWTVAAKELQAAIQADREEAGRQHRVTCGGCEGLGAHQRYCPQHPDYHPWKRLADQAEAISDTIGGGNTGLANQGYRLAWAIRAQILADQEGQDAGDSGELPLLRAQVAELRRQAAQDEERHSMILQEWEKVRTTLKAVRQALQRHPEACDHHPEGDPISCGWKAAVVDVAQALDSEGDTP